jgi:hypothetical protein
VLIALRSQSGPIREGDELSRALLALAKRSDRLPPESRVHLLYAVGKYYDDIGDPDTAFSYWLKGAALKRKSLPSSTGVNEKAVRQPSEFEWSR